VSQRVSSRASTRGERDEPVEYYLAVPGLAGAALALLAGRGALLAHRRFRGHPGYARWHDGSMAKVVLRAESDEITLLARTRDGLTIPELPDTPRLAVFRPRSRDQAFFLANLKLYSGRLARTPLEAWPTGTFVTIFANGDVDLSAGKLAAQVAHATLEVQARVGRSGAWAEWLEAGMPLALVRVPQRDLFGLIEGGAAYGVQDEGRTEIPRGTIAAAGSPPTDLARWRSLPDCALLAVHDGRNLTLP
jgi:peptidyl-tRNA hydrolase, PTH2 family